MFSTWDRGVAIDVINFQFLYFQNSICYYNVHNTWYPKDDTGIHTPKHNKDMPKNTRMEHP